MNYFIEQCYVVKEYGTTIVLQKKTIEALNVESGMLRAEIVKKDSQINLHLLQNEHCQKDKVYLEGELHKANRGKRLFKTGFVVMAGIAVVELGYIGVVRLVR